jgi:hypothetical protein
MAKVVFKKLAAGKKASRSTHEKRVIGADGRPSTVLTLDARSPTFGDDLQHLFERNVRKARRDNKRLLGSADIAPRKT